MKTKLRFALRPLLAAALLVLGGAASAQVFRDNALQALLDAERHAELDRIALQRVTAQADDAQAVLALGLSALRGNDAPRREAAIQRAEACLQKAPQAAPCHYALGTVLGVHAMSQGMLKIAASVGTVKESLLQAMTLDPQWYPARSAVVEFYLMAPGFAGGSVAKAQEAARTAAKPEQQQALEARVALHEERFDAALKLLHELRPGADSALADDAAQWAAAAGFGLLKAGRADAARPVFERLLQQRPDQAIGAYGLARVATDANAPAEAVRLLQQSAKLKGAENLPLDYRLGIALQVQGQNDAARAAYDRFIKAGRGARSALDDAKKRLAALSANG
ncbi:tetratricopeptide repeat protein [Aquincola sp. S2]|uniref:Tetratricopeptide repeat protein n=1 Tax=Pseudaquabacterium terrae TaxID=2732868 RepID=A0ABX2EK78_9BURK|nr:tetratricopeptide repeat protein [Aquabacterium terrae]NRF69014.1 tetratricopeptide repeat protein [Aquabacterium terrae]